MGNIVKLDKQNSENNKRSVKYPNPVQHLFRIFRTGGTKTPIRKAIGTITKPDRFKSAKNYVGYMHRCNVLAFSLAYYCHTLPVDNPATLEDAKAIAVDFQKWFNCFENERELVKHFPEQF